MNSKIKKAKHKKINKNKVIIKVNIDLEKALGSAHRDQYLANHPHGFSKLNHVHKSKKRYSRKQKHRE
jgi:hypothetical protein